MSASTAFATALLQHILQNAGLANVGDATGLLPSSADGNLYISLHTADPGAGGNQSTNEISYTSYARIPVPRDDTEWEVAAGVGTNLAAILFAESTGGTGGTVTHFGIGSASSGNGNLFLRGTLAASRVISTGSVPEFPAETLEVTVS
ncbi:phage tail fiber protein [Luteimonas saliphila]|uniref:phage tail fiber protein n=1 Tax=Luteimonas saliphila TaxID=2804919 RepID=UPI00192DBA53|nr:hypothetical protein [Luteimonas saliphila]